MTLLDGTRKLDVQRKEGRLLLEVRRPGRLRPNALHFLAVVAADFFLPADLPLWLIASLFLLLWLWDLGDSQKITVSRSGVTLEWPVYLLRLPSSLIAAEVDNLRVAPSPPSMSMVDRWRRFRGKRGPVAFEWRDETVRWGDGLGFSEAQRALGLIQEELSHQPRSPSGEYTHDSGPQYLPT